MNDAHWYVLLGADGIVAGVAGGAPADWAGKPIDVCARDMPALRDAARKVLDDLHSPAQGTNVEARDVAVAGAPTCTLVAAEVVPLRRADVEIARWLRATIAPLEPQARAIEASLTVSVDPGVPRTARFDPRVVAWAVTTIVGNALRFIHRGTRALPGGTIDVCVQYESESEELVFAIVDDGPGMPASVVNQLRSPVATGDGPAIALAMVRSFIEAHGGTMEIETTPGDAHGTTVILRMPAA